MADRAPRSGHHRTPTVSIGGINGVFMDITLDPSWAETCPFSEGKPVVPFIIGGGVSSLEHVILPGFQERLYLLEKDSGNVAIEIGPEGASLEEYLQKVEPIISSLQPSVELPLKRLRSVLGAIESCGSLQGGVMPPTG